MINNHKRILAILLAIVMVASILVACAKNVENDEKSSSTTTTTTTTTKPTTTENLETTFAENSTKKVYNGLKKDKDGDYPYKLATYTSYYKSSDVSRTENLKTAVSKINNICIPTDAVFSFNQTVGKRTLTAGYSTAKVIQNGDFVDGLGGGVCQVSSTVFQCVLRANVDIVYRTNHSLKISYVPLGGDATVQWNSKDFKFKNTTGTPIRLKMECNNGRLTCSVYGKSKVDVGDVKINITGSGKDYVLTRTVNGKQNYKTSSHYQEQKTTTAKKTTNKAKDKTTKKKDKTKKETTKKEA